MKTAQGNTRSMPDGFLHIQNFTVTRHSGIAGLVYTSILDQNQKSVVEGALIELAIVKAEQGAPLHHYKHETWRFRKDFLKKHFKSVVHACTKVMQTPVIEVFKAKLFAERESL